MGIPKGFVKLGNLAPIPKVLIVGEHRFLLFSKKGYPTVGFCSYETIRRCTKCGKTMTLSASDTDMAFVVGLSYKDVNGSLISKGSTHDRMPNSPPCVIKTQAQKRRTR